MASKSAKLTARQTRFVVEYLKDQNGTQAAIRAGYAKATANREGCRLLTNAVIAAAVAAKQLKVAKKAEVTVESLHVELEQARALALKTKQVSASVAATMGKAKLAGLIVDKHKHSGAIGTYDLSKLSDAQLATLETILGPLADDGGDTGGEGEA